MQHKKRRRNDSTRELDPIIGGNLKRIRRANRLSQEALADILSVGPQQLQKYERGTNRISLGRAYQAACHMNFELSDLLEGLPAPVQRPAPKFTDETLQLASLVDRLSVQSREAVHSVVVALLRAEGKPT